MSVSGPIYWFGIAHCSATRILASSTSLATPHASDDATRISDGGLEIAATTLAPCAFCNLSVPFLPILATLSPKN